MLICDKGHKQIVWDENDKIYCPLCDALDQVDTAENDLDTLRDELEIAQERIKELEIQLDPEPQPPERNEDDPRKDR